MSRSKIGSEKRSHRSNRASKGDIAIINKVCLVCGHHKCISKPRGVFCTKCGFKQ